MTKEPKDIAVFRQAVHPRGTRLFSGVIRRDHIPPSGPLIFRH